MELLTFNIDISSFHPHILRKMHAQFNTIINDNSEAVYRKLGNRKSPFFVGMYQTVLKGQENNKNSIGLKVV